MTLTLVRHTADLSPEQLAEARALLFTVFAGDDPMTDDDWEHCLGGLHVLVHDGPELVAHGAVVMRRLLHAGRALRCGYVEGVAVRAGRRRRGLGGVVMAELERVVRAAYDLGALGATDDGAPFYASRGWRPWPGTTSTLTTSGLVRTPGEDGWIYVFGGTMPLEALDLTGDLACGPRLGDAW
ncbi:GNAT family N-acetyltransferase [Spongisporangium articulatum]|uniref:GNAT family N-acetyltransferase n=1 Tax=Spongisporangium articulatum TaxID=3362603 RepID=A0ABW8AHX0_9ACTN